MDNNLRQYLIVTACYWAFTLTDGALRMLVVLYFHNLGYSPLEVASLFLLYELFGVVTNLFGGWLAAHKGLNLTMKLGLGLQIIALCMLLLPSSLLTIAYVMVAQALSGIAKDLNKMSAKSSIKTLVPDQAHGKLYRWVAIMTGSKNTLKGVGFFLGAALLAAFGFQAAVGAMAVMLFLVLIISMRSLQEEMGRKPFKPKFKELLSKSQRINLLSAARFFLFGSRDIWFVVALPVYLQSHLDWGHLQVGALLACWIIAYGLVQSISPVITGSLSKHTPNGRTAFYWALPLIIITSILAWYGHISLLPSNGLVMALLIFGAFFAINSSVHSYLIVAYAEREGVSLDVGFYYMANAAGRLVGTLLSGYIYQQYGFAACLFGSSLFILAAALISLRLPTRH